MSRVRAFPVHEQGDKDRGATRRLPCTLLGSTKRMHGPPHRPDLKEGIHTPSARTLRVVVLVLDIHCPVVLLLLLGVLEAICAEINQSLSRHGSASPLRLTVFHVIVGHLDKALRTGMNRRCRLLNCAAFPLLDPHHPAIDPDSSPGPDRALPPSIDRV